MTRNTWKVEKQKALLKIECQKGHFVVTTDIDSLPQLIGFKWRLGKRGHVISKAGVLARMVVAAPPNTKVWHRNGNHMDNRSANLCFERPRVRAKDFKMVGTSYDKARGKWRAYKSVDGVRKWLGWFDDYDEAEDALRALDLTI